MKPSRIHRPDDGSLRLEIGMDAMNEMAWRVMVYGKEAVVEQPALPRRSITQHIQNMAQHDQVQ